MKKFIFTALFISATLITQAEVWYVYIFRGKEIIVVRVTTKPLKGENMTIVGPFPDGNMAPTININNTVVTASLVNDSIFNGNAGAKDKYAVVVNNNNKVTIYKVKNDLAVGTYFVKPTKENKMKGACNGRACQFVVIAGNAINGGLIINGKAIKVKEATVTYTPTSDGKHGDILIDNVPIEGY